MQVKCQLISGRIPHFIGVSMDRAGKRPCKTLHGARRILHAKGRDRGKTAHLEFPNSLYMEIVAIGTSHALRSHHG
jgi:hypothetical protein